ncbi:MAG TPA: UDP-N-acetylmuramate--L-alanine ligase [Actinomycetota bacterium]|nr:UDP-N-acetylmuramate--L-alanine ligase [Actinomycetota bacterium]
MTLAGARRVHFVGIGGAGMSAIAKVLVERGIEVTGSDLKRSRAATVLEAMGAGVHVGHDAGLVEGADAVVVSSAIPERNPELAAARAAGIPVVTRGEALAAVLSDTRAIVVAGTHGKTTTTSMIVSILRAAGRDPTYLVGGGLNDAGTNARFGRDDVAVAESDESDGSFLLLQPHVAVVTNVEADHVDYWPSLDELRAAFARFMGRVPPDGAVVVPADDDAVVAAARATGRRVVRFGDGGEVRASGVSFGGGGARFTLHAPGGDADVTLRVPGMHNVLDALAAAAAALETGADVASAARGLGDYAGVERRFHVRGRVRGVTVIDDYAHHPTEVRATLAAARPGPWRRVVAVFQPHRYSRTRAFAREFGAAFEDADRVVVTDVYGAGEQPQPGVSGKLVADAVCAALPGRPVAYLPHRDELLSYVVATARPGDALLTLGAGDVTTVGEEVLARLGAGP